MHISGICLNTAASHNRMFARKPLVTVDANRPQLPKFDNAAIQKMVVNSPGTHGACVCVCLLRWVKEGGGLEGVEKVWEGGFDMGVGRMVLLVTQIKARIHIHAYTQTGKVKHTYTRSEQQTQRTTATKVVGLTNSA
jgi:hypothetical protein